ncbi:MAG TPA: glycosyltransferase family 4 protein [Thermoanaerobaculia bacterium]|nr:glycosyltransferase family 4 protein [Thermoanaerobaculia bacterium]
MARRLRATAPAAVLCCEISAAATFRLARYDGALALLDAPSLHHAAQDRLHGTTDPPSLHRRIVATKDAEIATAHHILTVSPIARETYVAAGVAEDRVHSVLLGADLELFTPPRETRSSDGPFRFVFAGARIRRKAFDLLVKAFEEAYRSRPDARLALVGPAGDAESALPRECHAGIEILGPVGQQELAEVFRRSHCLVLPSRNDSYGMVVAEALASGLPVVVSEMVGSKELVRPEETGWIVPVDDLDALTRRLLACVDQRARLAGMGPTCRTMAETASWEAYHRRFAELVRELLQAHREDTGRRGSPPP